MAALAANFTVTGSIQTGMLRQSTLLPFAEQQQLSLKDAFITDGNLAQLADGLGTTLGSAYVARARAQPSDPSPHISNSVPNLSPNTNPTTRRYSNSTKYFFANATKGGKAPVPEEAAAIRKAIIGRAHV